MFPASLVWTDHCISESHPWLGEGSAHTNTEAYIEVQSIGEELLHVQGGPQKVSPNGLLVLETLFVAHPVVSSLINASKLG